MTRPSLTPATVAGRRDLVRRILDHRPLHGRDFDPCRSVLRAEADGEAALANPRLLIDDTRTLVAVLKDLAHGAITPEDLL